jgi:nucleoside-diphosphate-sugar epimerase
MTILVVGASGATGRLLVEQLLRRGQSVKAIVRSPEGPPGTIRDQDKVSIIQASILDLSESELARHAEGCAAVASCLGHNLTLSGMFGQPRLLVTEATRRLCVAIRATQAQKPVRFVLMNTTGNRNRDLDEPLSFGERSVTALLRILLPPHADNEQAAEYLRVEIGQDDKAVQWAVVRPDSLVDEDSVSEYELLPSPVRSAIFNAGKTSRINVAHFMAELITDDGTWSRWMGRMPVIYDS